METSPITSEAGTHATANNDRASLMGLPAELVQHILTFLGPVDLARAACACRELYQQSYDDQIWLPIVNDNLSRPISTLGPAKSFRELYLAHRPHWFLAKNVLWLDDSYPSGKLLIARYDEEQGTIEAHTVVAQRGTLDVTFWEKDPEVIIHSFDPQIALDMRQPVVRIATDSPFMENEYAAREGSRYSKEVLMDAFTDHGLYSSFMLCRELPSSATSPATAVWPPLRFPADHRTRNESHDRFTSSGHRPTTLSEVSQNNFRIRKWVEFTSSRSSPALSSLGTGMPPHLLSGGEMTIRMPEGISTFASLPERCYMPTVSKPYQGIWCGDYSGHGCEFLVVSQPDQGQENPLPDNMNWLRRWFTAGRRESSSSDTSFVSAVSQLSTEDATSAASTDDADDEGFVTQDYERDYNDVPQGRLEAIKLTGDPNIPRGEYTFIAPDIGHGGFQRVADEELFKGARVVRCAGHIAGRQFQHDQYTPSQLILISHDKLAQFWEGFGHISYYHRVDLDALYQQS